MKYFLKKNEKSRGAQKYKMLISVLNGAKPLKTKGFNTIYPIIDSLSICIFFK